MLDRPSSAVKKSVVMRVGALLAMMAILVLSNPAPNGIFAHPHDSGQTHIGVAADTDDHIHIHYAENGMGPVRDFDSTDPEGSGIEWNVRGVDAADFEISTAGVLTFVDSPDYENPTDRGLNLNPGDDDNFDGNGEFAPDNNNYQITVSATEMRAGPDAPLPAKRTDIALTVIVGNADDAGELTLQWLQPEVTTAISATLTDPDGDTSISTWAWYTSKAADPEVGNSFHWNAIATETGASYAPTATDDGKYLWVRVAYTDPQGSDTKTADAKSENPVRAEVSDNANASPDFEDNTDQRTVPESTAVGDPVGAPVTATDTDNDTLTYELDNDILSTSALAADSDLQFFDIDMATGQIEVAKELDFDAVGAGRATGAVAGTYTVVVRATDPSGEADNITVTIMAENVNEDPIVTGRAEISVPELTGGVYVSLPDAPDVQPQNDGSRTYSENEYVFEEPDHLDSIADWQLEGDDAAAFDLSGGFEPRYIQFKEAPDFENPTDANSDNVYEVTLVAIDTGPSGAVAGIGKVNVWLIVENVDEVGKVVFTEGETAYLNEMLVAEVQDPDDKGGDLGEPYQGVHIVTWQWSRALTDVENAVFDDIEGATTNRYTPRDMDRGFYLRATATYTDPHSAPDDAGTDTDERITAAGSLKTGEATTENVVRLAPGPASVPAFDETGTVTREVAENTLPGGDVGAPVVAMGPVTLVYLLDGSDAQYFNIDDMGQITVGGDDPDTQDTELGTNPELDYEKKKMFSVTVKVEVMNGDANQKAQVDVNIIVTDLDEEPKITDEDVDVAPMTAVMYPEIGEDGAPNTAAVATYVGTDPEGNTISWDLRGADAALFTIDGGVLKFRNAPDYENPRDVDGDLTDGDHSDQDDANIPDDNVDDTVTPDAVAGNNEYNIVIRAIASRASGDTGPAETVDTTVTVIVTDVDEDGVVVISWLQPEVDDDTNTGTNTVITATLTDPDGPTGIDPPTTTAIASPTLTWFVSEVIQGFLDVDNPDHWGATPSGNTDGQGAYTPEASDEGKYLRVTASYDDRHGSTKTARMMSAYPVQAAGLGANNESPDFDGAKVDRSVAETAEVGDDVPGPVVATVVASSDTDILTYGLRAVVVTGNADDIDTMPDGVTAPADDDAAAADAAAFDIDKATGQITVAQELDFESRGDGKYVVVATVTDPSGLGDDIVVVIEAEDRNEDPVLRGRPELTIDEIDGGAEDADSPDFDGQLEPEGQDPVVPTVNVYNVDDEDDRASVKSWRLEGEDKDQFQLIGTVGRTLVFTTQPDYENPADADGDNVYKVTVVAIDNDDGRGEFDVCIAVMNINEDGKITLRDKDGNELVQPHANGPITADLTDPDGGVTRVMWGWERSQVNPPTVTSPLTAITGATSATYKPTNDDKSWWLKVTATYMDAKNDAPTDPPDPDADTNARTANATAAHAVLEVEDLRRGPEFPEETAMRMVAENAPSTTFVGEPLSLAMDLDGPVGLTYTLEGSDNGSEDTAFFELFKVTDNGDERNSTQIRVKLHDEAHDLDHEAEGRNGMYEVVLKVTDGSDLVDTITVTIMVTDRNEAPSTPMEAEDGAVTTPTNNAPVFGTATTTRSVAENTAAGENIGDPVAATDADAGDTLAYTLGGTDMASFAIDSATGQLMTLAALDFEMPADADTDNAYEVTVTASDGNAAADATIAVTITVTDMGLADSYDANEDGMIDGTEVLNAVEDYFNDVSGIDSERVLDIVELYFNS